MMLCLFMYMENLSQQENISNQTSQIISVHVEKFYVTYQVKFLAYLTMDYLKTSPWAKNCPMLAH